MTKGSWKASDWDTYSTKTTKGKTATEIFTKKTLDPSLDPKGVKVRESVDSDAYPKSTALAVFLDQTGSMGTLAEDMIRNGLNVLATEIYSRKPISDPHIMFGAIGDVASMREQAPLQVTQFEVDIRIAEQLQTIFIEGCGGGNDSESYTFPWYFMAMHTDIDCFEKRGKKGYLFTVGDECVPPVLKATEIEMYLGYKPQKDFTAEELLTMVSRKYHVFHLMVEQGNHMRYDAEGVKKSWGNLLGQRAILLSDSTKMSEVIVSTIQAIEGEKISDIVASWDGSTGVVVSKAIKDLAANGDVTGDVVTFS